MKENRHAQDPVDWSHPGPRAAGAGRNASRRATASRADVVFEWNQILQDTVPSPQNPLTPRFFAMTHIAMFDAINALEREFTPYHVRIRHGGGSPEAAAAQAAHDVLVAINPAAHAQSYDAALAQAARRPVPRASSAAGRLSAPRVAAEVLAWRQNDGWVVSPVPGVFASRPCPGAGSARRRPTPTAAFTHLQKAAPAGPGLTATQFLPPPPPIADERTLRHRS